MITAYKIIDARKAVSDAKKNGKTVSFVPTMGALHDGHLSLLEIARKEADFPAMSIFVNRIQFNDKNDFDKYPRNYDADRALIEKNGCALAFLPDDAEMYRNPRTFVNTEYLDEYLCGAKRPGHFKGVCTVVTKLFNIIQPDVAIFGQKDIQQVAILSKMIEDLNIPVRMIIAPIKRDESGLALSSRNAFLSADEKNRALAISRALKSAENLIQNGERSASAISDHLKSVLIGSGRPDSIDYISVVDFSTLHPVDRISGKSIIAIAVYFGTTRLIDNMIIDFNKGSVSCMY
jgi:pantoate--beta-alanine ligase